MPLFKEPGFDPKREADHARARISGQGSRHNVSFAPYLIPILGAILAIGVAIHALSRPSVVDHLRQTTPRTLEIDLE
jgi:hypothetical protein